MLLIECSGLISQVEMCDIAYQRLVDETRLHVKYLDKLSETPGYHTDKLAELVQSLKVEEARRKHLDAMGETISLLRMAIKDAEREFAARN